MKQHVFRLSLLSLVATAGVAVIVLTLMLAGGFFVENWRPDWSIGDSVVEAVKRGPKAGQPKQPVVSLDEAFQEGIWIWMPAILAPLAWYLVIWAVWGRDPLAGVTFPRFFPPDGLSPATVRQIVGMGFDEKAMAAELLSLAVRGHIRLILTTRGDFGLRRTDKGPGELTTAERRLLSVLFRGTSEIVIGRRQGVRLRVAMETFQKHLEDELEGPVYATNVGATLTGVMVSGVAFMVAAMAYRDTALQNSQLTLAVVSLLAVAAVNVLFFTLMKAPTKLGREILDEIAGFRMFLATAEHERMKMADAPDMTDHLYATHLPYALALDMELAWSDQFSYMLDRAIPDPMDYEWYAGSESFGGGLVDMARSLGASIAGVFEADEDAPA